MDEYCFEISGDEEEETFKTLRGQRLQTRLKKGEENDEVDKKLIESGMTTDELEKLPREEKLNLVKAMNLSLNDTPQKDEEKSPPPKKQRVTRGNNTKRNKKLKYFSDSDSDEPGTLDKKANMTVDEVMEKLSGKSNKEPRKRTLRGENGKVSQQEPMVRKRRLGPKPQAQFMEASKTKYDKIFAQFGGKDNVSKNKKPFVPAIVRAQNVVMAASTPKARSTRSTANRGRPAARSRGNDDENKPQFYNDMSTILGSNKQVYLGKIPKIQQKGIIQEETVDIDDPDSGDDFQQSQDKNSNFQKRDSQKSEDFYQLYEEETQIMSQNTKEEEESNAPHITMADLTMPYRLDDLPLIDRRNNTEKPVVAALRLFCPEGVSYKFYASKIKQYFDRYHKRLNTAQAKLQPVMNWGLPVQPGRHWSKTIDIKERGNTSTYLDVEDTQNDTDEEWTPAVEITKINKQFTKVSLRKTKSVPVSASQEKYRKEETIQDRGKPEEKKEEPPRRTEKLDTQFEEDSEELIPEAEESNEYDLQMPTPIKEDKVEDDDETQDGNASAPPEEAPTGQNQEKVQATRKLTKNSCVMFMEIFRLSVSRA